MKTWKSFLAFIAILSVGAVAAFGQGASPRRGTIVVPDSSVQRPEDVGVRAHTNHLIFVPAGGKLVLSSPTGETPTSLGCVYQINGQNLSTGCPISYKSTDNHPPQGGSGIIAIVDAYHYPTAANDFVMFSNKFGLPSGNECGGGTLKLPCFTQVPAVSGHIKSNSGWALEAALDIEWAHAMAPNAQIVLVEAASNSNADLFDAVAVATNEVVCGSTSCPSGGNGKGEVSMSWGGSEFSQETTYDTYFSTPGVVYTAASGDSGGVVIYPSASPYVVSAGGTTINRDSSGNFKAGDETAWSSGGGGDSAYEPVPGYQSQVPSVENLVGSLRGTPDFSYDADPSSGVSVYDTTSYQGLTGWFTVGGTSVSSPSLAGIINLAASKNTQTGFAADTLTELGWIYGNLGNGSDFTDITSGSTTGCSGGGGGNPHHKSKTSSTSSSCFSAQQGWDFITGVGTNLGFGGK